MRRSLLAVTAAAALLAGCDSKREELAAALQQSQALSAEKDSLLSEMLATTALVNDINGELAKARGVGVSPVLPGEQPATPAAQDRQVVLGTIREVITRLNDAEAQLEKSKARVESMALKDRRLLGQLAQYRKQLADLKTTTETQASELNAIIEQQKAEIASLNQNLDTMRVENATLAARTTALTDSVAQLASWKNTVYVVTGTKKELLEKGVIVQEGSKFLFFGGRQVHPARDLDPQAFEIVDRTQTQTIQLPRADKNYRIVSRQSTGYVQTDAEKPGQVRGQLQITSPEEFWAPSKFLIVMED